MGNQTRIVHVGHPLVGTARQEREVPAKRASRLFASMAVAAGGGRARQAMVVATEGIAAVEGVTCPTGRQSGDAGASLYVRKIRLGLPTS